MHTARKEFIEDSFWDEAGDCLICGLDEDFHEESEDGGTFRCIDPDEEEDE